MSYKPIAIFLFWILGSIPIVTFLVYPLFMRLFSLMIKSLDPPESDENLPNLALLFSAFNEEKIIRKKIENCLTLRYPPEKLKIIIHTDGSTDKTDFIVSEYKDRGIVHLQETKNRGKTCALNDAIRIADSPILVFTDANSMYRPDALLKLVRWMKLKKVGCVCGRLIYKKTTDHHAEKGEIKYWDWDTRLKLWEGRSGHLLGSNGAIFALRSDLAVELPGDQSNDMILPIVARLRDYYAVYDPDAVAVEKTAKSVIEEYQRKIRIISRGLNGVIFALKYARQKGRKVSTKPGSQFFVLFQMICKKLFRYLSFPALFIMFWLGLFTSPGITFHVTLIMWSLILLCIIVTLVSPAAKRIFPSWPDLSYPLAMAWAGCAGFWIFITGKTMSHWKSHR